MRRAKEGLTLRNRLASELQAFYPVEYAVAEEALTELRDRVTVPLPNDEAANIAFHLINAARANPDFNALQAITLIDDVVNIVRYCSPQLEATRLDWARFLTHVKFFVERLMTSTMLTSQDDFLYAQMNHRYPAALELAERIRKHISATRSETVPNEEVAYLALHIQRLTGTAGS